MYKFIKLDLINYNESAFLLYCQHTKRSILNLFFCIPTSFLALLTLLLLTYNGSFVFCIHVPFLGTSGNTIEKWSSSLSELSSVMTYDLNEGNPTLVSKTHFSLMHNPQFSNIPTKRSSIVKKRKLRKRKLVLKYLPSGDQSKKFSGTVKDFFRNSTCKVRFFMTWISSLDSFGNREVFALESLFKSHPKACLVIVSSSMDSSAGTHILKPFWNRGYKAIAVAPDFNYIFKNTHAEMWFRRLKQGKVNPGDISLGQNLSNLLRLALLYKYGGVYMDSDFIVLKSFSKLRNTIGAQTMDIETGTWSRLNNAVLIFDKNHPLLFKFIQEFAFTFDGNKWGHNGPYLVSRVVSRVSGKPGFSFTILPPDAFYPVDWSRIRSLFDGPRDFLHSKWLNSKLRHIRIQSYAVHLWNRQSSKLEVEKGSILSHIMCDCSISCNSSSSSL